MECHRFKVHTLLRHVLLVQTRPRRKLTEMAQTVANQDFDESFAVFSLSKFRENLSTLDIFFITIWGWLRDFIWQIKCMKSMSTRTIEKWKFKIFL